MLRGKLNDGDQYLFTRTSIVFQKQEYDASFGYFEIKSRLEKLKTKRKRIDVNK